MALETIKTRHFVLGADLNHHGTLYAGRCTEWMVEAGLMAACNIVANENIVCMRINGLFFTRPVDKGTLLRFETRVCYAGSSSLVSYVKVYDDLKEEFIVDGFFHYISVDEKGKPRKHGIELTYDTDKEKKLFEEVMKFVGKGGVNYDF
jgi:acyl-CoA hydrolase